MDDIERVNDIVPAEPNKKGHMLLDGIVLLVLSLILYNLSLSSFFCVAPLMLFSARYGKTKGSMFIALGFLAISLTSVLKILPFGFSSITVVEIAMMLYIPMSLSAAGIIWLQTRGRKVSVRLLLSLLPSVAIILLFVVLFLADRALLDTLYTTYMDAFVAMLQPLFEQIGLTIDYEFIFTVFMLSFGSLIMPIVLTTVCANCFIYETVLHSRERDWEDKVVAIEFNPNLVWAFIVAWGLVLLSFFISVPTVVLVVVMNIAISFAVVYAIQGFAVLYTWLRRSMERLKSMTLFIILFIFATVIPGLNIVILLGLPIIGLLESFFDMKKIGERKDEDHS